MTPIEESIMRLERVLQDAYRTYLLQNVPAHRDPKSLLPFGYRVYSQNDEDGIIAEIFNRVGTTNRHFVEFGVENGMENNTAYLLVQGWTGAWIEGNPQKYNELQSIFQPFLLRKQLLAGNGFVTAENIETYLETLKTPAEIDLLSIDIDYNDYWVWKSITRVNPRVVVIEFNTSWGPSFEWKINYRANGTWDGTRNFGASLKALELLGGEKGYALVGCNINGVNAFFVRQDLIGDRFLAPYTSEHHYEPGRFLMRFPEGHPKTPREMENFR